MLNRLVSAAVMVTILCSVPAEAGLFNAASRAAAKKIMKHGFSLRRMNPFARFGKGVYASERKATALTEKPLADSLLRLKASKSLRKSIIDSSRLSKDQLRSISGASDLRGAIHKGVIGPRLGRRLGRYAAEKGKVIRYRSARDVRGSNIFIPRKVYQNHPRIIRPVREIPVTR